MSTTILYEQTSDDLSHSLNSALLQQFSSSPSIQMIEISPDQINPCLGCFSCWLKTPGKCIIKNDLASRTNPIFVQSDLVIIVSPIYYGCYSSTMKRLLDRIIPNILPFFRNYKGEVHHQPRYKHLANQVIIAYGTDISNQEKETFLALTRANATNLGINDPEVFFCSNKAEIASTLAKVGSYLKTFSGKESSHE